MITSAAYEPEAVSAFKGWLSETGRSAYACGPLLPSASKATAEASEKAQSKESDEIQTLLDDTLKSSGKQSLLLVNNSNARSLLVTG